MNQPVARHGSDEATYLVQAPTTAPVPGSAANVDRHDAVAHLPQGELAAADIADDLTLRGPLGGEIVEPDTPHLGDGTPPHAVSAYDLQLHGPRGLVYGPVDLEIPAGEVVVLQGPQGAGRSSLLLTLAGRMAPDHTPDGWLVVLGENLTGRRARRTAVQRRAAIAGFHGIDELDDAVTVGDSVRERLTWLAPWYRRTPKVTQEVYERVARPVFGRRELPALDAMVWDLDEVDAMLLRIAIAMAQDPELLVVDDLDQVHDSARRQIVWERLEALAATGVTVIGSVASAGEVDAMRWGRAPHVVRLATGPQLVAA
ncbi:ATP-binding cassette domain-containing protein [Oerskovia jenensis]|uniref:ATP-binding cassette domain-containing protein n=1 Tax=Oerskovia jenensis TaxID=162169 RepID=UPI0036DEAD49